MDSLAGKLLVAIPDLPDSNFYRTVVFVIEHSDEGAMGVVLNRPSNVDLYDLWQQFDSDVEVYVDGKVHVGGPVKGPILALHDQFSLTDELIIDDVYITTSSDRLNQLVCDSNIQFKAFSGYSGWGPKQLDSELEHGGWLVADATANDIYGHPDLLWKSVCERVGKNILFPGLPDLPMGGDPNLN